MNTWTNSNSYYVIRYTSYHMPNPTNAFSIAFCPISFLVALYCTAAGGGSGLSGSLGITGGLGLGTLSSSYAQGDSRDLTTGPSSSASQSQSQLGQGLGLAPMKISTSNSKPPPAAKVAPPSGIICPNPR